MSEVANIGCKNEASQLPFEGNDEQRHLFVDGSIFVGFFSNNLNFELGISKRNYNFVWLSVEASKFERFRFGSQKN